MKPFTDLVAHGGALLLAIVILALAAELKQETKANQLERQPQDQAIKETRLEPKGLKADRKERRAERRERRKERRDTKPERKIAN